MNATGLQLPQLCERHERDASANSDELQSRLRLIFDLDVRLPPFAPEKLPETARGRNDILQGIHLVPARLRELEGKGEVDAATLSELSGLTRRVTEEIGKLHRSLKQIIADNAAALDKSPEVVELSKQYCFLNAAAACLQIWIYNRVRLDELFACGEWLVLCLDRLLKVFDSLAALTPRPHAANVAQGLLRLYREDRMFSIIPFELASTMERTSEGLTK